MSYYDRWVIKENPYHDDKGRFTSASSGTEGGAFKQTDKVKVVGGLNSGKEGTVTKVREISTGEKVYTVTYHGGPIEQVDHYEHELKKK